MIASLEQCAQSIARIGIAQTNAEVGPLSHQALGISVELATVIGLFNFFNRFADALQILPPPGATGKD